MEKYDSGASAESEKEETKKKNTPEADSSGARENFNKK